MAVRLSLTKELRQALGGAGAEVVRGMQAEVSLAWRGARCGYPCRNGPSRSFTLALPSTSAPFGLTFVSDIDPRASIDILTLRHCYQSNSHSSNMKGIQLKEYVKVTMPASIPISFFY